MIMGSIQPNRAVPEPNMMPKPTSQNIGVPMQKSIRFFIRMFPVFFARVKPASHMEKPACIKNTSAAPSSTQIVLTELYVIISHPSLSSDLYQKKGALTALRRCQDSLVLPL